MWGAAENDKSVFLCCLEGATCRWCLEQGSFQNKNDPSAMCAQDLAQWVQSPIRLLGAIGIVQRVICRMCEWHPRYSSSADGSLSFISVNGCNLQRAIYNPNKNVFSSDHWKTVTKKRAEVKYNSKDAIHMWVFLSQAAWVSPHKMTVASADNTLLKRKKSEYTESRK